MPEGSEIVPDNGEIDQTAENTRQERRMLIRSSHKHDNRCHDGRFYRDEKMVPHQETDERIGLIAALLQGEPGGVYVQDIQNNYEQGDGEKAAFMMCDP
jgi:hypothetical protein